MTSSWIHFVLTSESPVDRDNWLLARTVCRPPAPGGNAGADYQAGHCRAIGAARPAAGGGRGEEGRRAAVSQIPHQIPKFNSTTRTLSFTSLRRPARPHLCRVRHRRRCSLWCLQLDGRASRAQHRREDGEVDRVLDVVTHCATTQRGFVSKLRSL